MLYDMLEPFSDFVIATYATNNGSVSLVLGQLAHTLDRHDDAVDHLRHALDVLSHQVGVSRLIGGCTPMALWRR